MTMPNMQVPELFRRITSQPNWYDQLDHLRDSLTPDIIQAQKAKGEATDDKTVRHEVQKQLVGLFAQLLQENAVTLGEAGPNWDEQRQAIDTVVMHHTGGIGPMDLERLNAMHLLNLYVPKYRNPGEDLELIGGTPIYSGHADAAGNQVFYGYHWLIREDGSREHLLPDETIGWHAGNWGVNTRSVAVCFDGDLEQGQPTREALDSAVELIATSYDQVDSKRILGHNAIVQTICPGGEFTMWGEELRALVDANRATS